MSRDLTKYDFIFALDKSGSMSSSGNFGLTRWKEAQETVLALATKAQEFDDDGITVIPFANSFKVYDNVTAAKVDQIFRENDPSGGTDTAGVLKFVFESYLQKDVKTRKPVIMVVLTDGEPNDQNAVKNVIREFASKLTPNSSGTDTDEFGILFLQVGNDSSATKFLKELDDNLNARFDIVSTKTSLELENITLVEALNEALDG